MVVEKKSKNVSANQRPGWPSWTSDRHENTNLKESVEDLLPVKFRQNPFSGCGEEAEKCFSQSEARAAILDFRSARKNTNLIEGVEDLLPVKFCQNPFSGCGEKVEKCYSLSEARAAILDDGSAQKKTTNLVEDVEFLLSVKFRHNLFSGFVGEVKNVKVFAGRTDDGQRAMTIAHLSLRLR